VANLADEEIQVVVQMVVEELSVMQEIVATAVVVATVLFKIVLTTKHTGWSSLVVNNVGHHMITTMLIMGLEEVVGKPVATLMDRVLHIRIMTTVTIMGVGDMGILEKRQRIWKISLALSTMRVLYVRKKKWKEILWKKYTWRMKMLDNIG
jgi:hypothetical protein